jgi:hypothetical protein
LPAPRRQTSLARHRSQDIAGKTSLARHRWQDIAGKTSLARHRWQDTARSTCTFSCRCRLRTREAAEAALELDPFFIARGCVSGVEVRTLAVAEPPDLVLLRCLLEPSPRNSGSPIDPISATRPLRRTKAPPSTPSRARVPPRRRIW